LQITRSSILLKQQNSATELALYAGRQVVIKKPNDMSLILNLHLYSSTSSVFFLLEAGDPEEISWGYYVV